MTEQPLDIEKISRTCIIIPAFNAETTIKQAVNDIKHILPETTIIVINDGSADKTGKILKELDVILITNKKNSGLGAAVKKGVAFALKNGFEFFITIGADKQRDEKDILKLLYSIYNNNYNIVFGSKLMLPGQSIPLIRKSGAIFLTFLVNFLFKGHFSDVLSGFKVFDKKVASYISGLSDSYVFDTDLCIMIISSGYKYNSIPVNVYYHSESSRIRNIIITGINIFYTIISKYLKNSR